MKKLLLVDANSMVFRAYYATAYTRMMTTSSGQPTNALYGFANMVFKALEMLEPEGVLFAFDSKAKTFRHKQYEQYKGTRAELPQELIDQFALVREYLDAFDVIRYEIEGYEADDIIGTMVSKHPDAKKIILTSDRDLLQLIDDNTSVLLMKKGITETQLVDVKTLKEEQGLDPSQIVDLKSLMGDSSDNIPGVAGVGEKTAKKLLDDYKTLDGVYQNIKHIKGKLQEKLQTQKDLAYLSYDLATIYREVPLDLSEHQLTFQPNWQETAKFFRTYEMNSMVEFISKFEENKQKEKHIEFTTFKPTLYDDKTFVMAVNAKIEDTSKTCDYFLLCKDECISKIEYNNVSDEFIAWAKNDTKKIVFDGKTLYHLFSQIDGELKNVIDDVWVMAFLDDTSLTSLDKIKDKWQITIDKNNKIESDVAFSFMVNKKYEQLIDALKEKQLFALYNDVEFPLIDTLYRMEKQGISVDLQTLYEISEQTEEKVKQYEQEIFDISKHTFNINSPKQLAEVLYDKLNLPQVKKRSTAIDVLESLISKHPVIEKIMQYRKYQKFYSTYTEGLKKYVQDDNKIHTDYNQCATQTGRLSSNHPNMQNISIKNEETAIIRKIFVAEENSVLLAADYSQIELRLLAHMANEKDMIDAFNNDIDIHTKTAMDIFDVGIDDVTSIMRRQAKAVNFGIIYGMSDYGLANQINVSRKEAAQFMKAYNESYPNIAQYMEDIVAFAQEHGYVKTIFERRRVIEELYSNVYSVREFGKRAAMNAPIQGSAADLMKMAMLQVDNKLKEKKAKSTILLQVHDEIVLNVLKDELEWVKKLVQETMENVVALKVPLKLSLAVGDNWYQAK